MINSNYSKAYSEVLEIISALSRIEYNKIPIKYIEYLEENADRSEGFKYRQLTKTAIMVVKKPTLFKRFVNKLKKWFRF